MTTAAARRANLYSFEEFCALIPDGQKADLIDGVIYMASPAGTDDNELCGWLYRILSDFLEELLLGGRVFVERVAFRLDARSGPEPDIGYVGPDKLEYILPGYVACAPDVAVEIVSKESRERDYVTKRKKYEKAGVGEYWIVDPIQEKVTLLRMSPSGVFKPVRPRHGVYTSKIIAGFWFRAEWFWQSPLPEKKKTLEEIVATTRKSK